MPENTLTKAAIVERLSALGVTITKTEQKKTPHAALLAQLQATEAKVTKLPARKTVDLDAGSPDADVKTRKPSKGVNFAPRDAAKPARMGTKVAALIDALARPQGATIEDLVRVTGWRDAGTCKSGLYWDVRQKGYGCETRTDDAGQQTYHLVLPEGCAAVPQHMPIADRPVKLAANKS